MNALVEYSFCGEMIVFPQRLAGRLYISDQEEDADRIDKKPRLEGTEQRHCHRDRRDGEQFKPPKNYSHMKEGHTLMYHDSDKDVAPGPENCDRSEPLAAPVLTSLLWLVAGGQLDGSWIPLCLPLRDRPLHTFTARRIALSGRLYTPSHIAGFGSDFFVKCHWSQPLSVQRAKAYSIVLDSR